jgi:hypothetical protein
MMDDGNDDDFWYQTPKDPVNGPAGYQGYVDNS